MAWLQNLAGRAEDLLNKIDQNAATVLNESNTKVNDVEIQIQDTSKEASESDETTTKNKESQSSLQPLVKNFSFQSSLVKDNIEGPENAQIQSIEQNSDFGIVFDITSEKQKSVNESVYDESAVDKSIKSSAKSDQMSTSSSLNNSFIIAQESQLLHEKLAKMEFENQDLNKQLLNMQHLYSELRNENANLQFQIERSNEQVAQAQIEKDQYIARAQRILQEKERLISLKQENNTSEETQNIYATYNEELKKELEFCQDKNNELSQKNNQLMKDIQSLQMQHQIIQNGLQQSNQNLEMSLINEKKYRLIAEEDCSQKMKELHLKTQELVQLQDLIRTKNNEIVHLKEVMKQKSSVNINDDVESRIKSLTQTLMLKQNNLETVTTERNALRLQLEKLENEYKKNLALLHRAQVKVVNVHEPDEPMPIPQFMRVSPFDAGVTRRVKRAYSTLDAISIRTGIFLRRYPVARVFVFCYMVLLHIWVLIILFLYAPTNR